MNLNSFTAVDSARMSELLEAALGKNTMRDILRDLFARAGIVINGNQPWDIHVECDKFYKRVLRDGSLGLGEAYMDGWWECEKLDEFIFRIVSSGAEENIRKNGKLLILLLTAAILNRGKKSKAFRIGEHHYDRGNELYQSMLDRRMVYSCAYWKGAGSLDEAQEAKLDLICRKINIQPGNTILDIGCGWGGFAKYAAEKYGARIVGITVSKEQAAFAKEQCSGLPVEIRLQDYRDVEGRFDHVVSVGMFEHVDYKKHRTYMEVASRCLKSNGLFLLHTIGRNETRITVDAWIEKYIFPNSMLPSLKQIGAAIEKLFIVEELHNLGANYDATLMSWFKNFDSNWDDLKEKYKEKYDERFYRMWKYWLLSSAAAFRSRDLQVWQIVLSKNGIPGGYDSIR